MFDSDQEGGSIVVNNIEHLDSFRNSDGSLTFLSVAGKPISLQGNIEQVSFISPEDVWQASKTHLPLGALVEFTVEGRHYVAGKEVNKIWSYPTHDLEKVIAIYPLAHEKYPSPNNAVILTRTAPYLNK